MVEHPAIFNYQNYRQFLRNFYRAHKLSSRGYSYSKFSADAGIESPNFLKLVIDGRKNLTTKTIQCFAKGLGLKANETDYFEALVLWNQAQSEEEKSYYKKRVRSFKGLYSKRVVKVDAKSGLYDHPLLPLIFAVLPGTRRSELAQNLHAHFGKNADAAKLADVLFKKDVLYVQDDEIQANCEHLLFSERIAGTILRTFLRSQLRLSTLAFHKEFNRAAKFYSHSMSLCPEHFMDLQELIKDFIDRTNKAYANDSGSAVQINIQSFMISPRISDAMKDAIPTQRPI